MERQSWRSPLFATGGQQIALGFPLSTFDAPGITMSPRKSGCGLLVFAVIAVMGGSAANAQNLDQGKPAPKLFAETCTACHRSPRGLAKDRFSLTLFLFLQKHYVSNSGSAWALTSYLESVDNTGKSRVAAKRSAATTGTSRSRFRPPAPVPAR